MPLLVPGISVHLALPMYASALGKAGAKGGGGFGKLMGGHGHGHVHGEKEKVAGMGEADVDPDEDDLAALTGHPKRHLPEEDAALDPAARQAAQLAPPFQAGPTVDAPSGNQALEAHVRTSLEDLLPQMVRKVAWSGDGRRGTMRLELGEGELAGGTLLVRAEHGRIAVHLSAPSGADVGAWRDRIAARLAARGLPVDDIEVD
jgi:hypothetical protein